MESLKFLHWNNRNVDLEISKNELYEIKLGSLEYQRKIESEFNKFINDDDLLNGYVL